MNSAEPKNLPFLNVGSVNPAAAIHRGDVCWEEIVEAVKCLD